MQPLKYVLKNVRPHVLLPALGAVLLATSLAFAQAPANNTPAPAQTPAVGGTLHAPIRAGGVMALDLPNSSAQSISLDIVQGRFSEYSVGRITLTGSGIDFRNGTLQGLKADVAEGNFDNLLVDKLSINAPAFSFNTMELLNNRTFILNQPVTAKVNVLISEAGINKFLANPKTMEKIEKSIQKKTGGLKLITFSNPSLNLLSGNKVKVNVTGIVGQGLSVPMEMTGKLGIQNGQLGISNLVVSSGGNDVQLPLDVATVFQDKINEIIDFKRLGKNSMVITADSMKLNGKILNIDGHATLTKLQFG
jgi:hypothetical protein